MSMVGYGDVYPKKPLGKTFTSVFIIIGIAIFGFTVAMFSSAMTVSQLYAPAILGPDDLATRPETFYYFLIAA